MAPAQKLGDPSVTVHGPCGSKHNRPSGPLRLTEQTQLKEKIMRNRLLTSLLIASFGVMAATAGAQPTPSAPNNSPRNAPVGTSTAPSTDGSADPAYGANNSAGMRTPGMMDSSAMPTTMTGYKSARAACEQQPLASREQCRVSLNTRYSGVAPKCQKLLGSALDECLKGADTGQ
jgi:hypothetical protein